MISLNVPGTLLGLVDVEAVSYPKAHQMANQRLIDRRRVAPAVSDPGSAKKSREERSLGWVLEEILWRY